MFQRDTYGVAYEICYVTAKRKIARSVYNGKLIYDKFTNGESHCNVLAHRKTTRCRLILFSLVHCFRTPRPHVS